MIKKLVAYLLRDIINEEIDRRLSVQPPLLNDIQISDYKKGKQLSVWDAMLMDGTQSTLCITYYDSNGLEDFITYDIKDLCTFKHYLKTFKPKYPSFKSVSIHAKPKESSSPIIEQFTKGLSSRVAYSSDQLNKIFNPIVDWIDEHPELLI